MGKVAIVTGGTGALGGAVARRFVEAGYEVHATSSRAAEDARTPVKVHAVDLTDFEAVRAFAAEFSEVCAVVLSAGGFAMAELAALTRADVDAMIDANFKTAASALAAFSSKLVSGSAVVVVGSQSYEGAARSAAYAASKAAVVSLAKSAALEWKERRVRVNAVLPDTIDTPANRRDLPGQDFTKWAEPREIADVIVWLCSPAAAVVSGNAIRVGR
ncbi:MAG TPA: SDR family NAD(P)-dependent oxidoreductase [Polyangiaceae bacterium]|nr:SDR family NAD(P)-dependent oxidoreductase [Polyangiaceae bacterium]